MIRSGEIADCQHFQASPNPSHTYIVHLYGIFSRLDIDIITKLVFAKVKSTNLEASLEFGWASTKNILIGSPRSGILILVGDLHHSPCGNYLSPNHAGNGTQSSKF